MTPWFAWREDRTEQQRRLAVDNFRKADEQRQIAEDLSATLTLDRGLALCERGEVSRGLLWLTRALEIVPSAETELQETVRANIASWRRPLTSLRGILPHPEGHVVGVAFDPAGKSFLSLHRTSDQKTISCAALGLVHAPAAGAGSAIHRSSQPVQPRCTRARCQAVEPRPHIDPGRGRRFGRTAVGHCHGPACEARFCRMPARSSARPSARTGSELSLVAATMRCISSM